jgi:hypothetical protein
MMRLRSLLVLFAALPLFASEIPLGDVSYDGTCEANRSRAVSNGQTFYGAWTFTHVGFALISGTVGGAATDADGALLTPTEHIIGGGPGVTAVASNGVDYLVAVDYSGGLSVRRVDARGMPVTALAALSSGVGGYTLFPTIGSSVAASWNGSHFLVAGTIAAGSGTALHSAVLAATIDEGGHTVQTRTIADNASVLDAAPAGQGRTLLLVLMNDTLQSLLIDDALTTTAPTTIATAPKTVAQLASNGSGYLAVWSAGGGINAVALDGNGLPHDASFTVHAGPVNPGPYDAVDDNPAITWDGSSYFVAWETGGVIYATRTNGGSAAPPFVLTPGYNPSLASNDDGDTLVLTGGGCGAISSSIIRRGALRTDAFTRTVSREAVSQGSSRALHTATGTPVVWYDQVWHLSFVDGSGAVSTQSLTSTRSFARADLIATPRGSAAAWPDGSAGVQVRQFDASGEVLGLPVNTGSVLAFDAALAALGDDVAVAYTQNRPDYPSGYDFLVSVVGADGTLRRTPILSSPQSQSFNSTLVAIGDHYLAVWRENQSSGTPLFSAVIDRNANVLAKQLIVDNARITIGTAIGTNGSDALLVWNGADASQAALYAQRLGTNGAPIGAPQPVATSHNNISQIHVVPEGANYVITYITVSDDSLSTLLRQITYYPDSSLSGRTLLNLPGGNVIDSYALDGANVVSLVLRRGTPDLETNGAARLYWTAMPAQHIRAVRNR